MSLPTEKGAYSAFVTPDGRAHVLSPDGLTWESDHPTLEAAQAYALALNEWVDARPSPTRVRPFFAPSYPLEPDPARLLRILDRLTLAEEHAYGLILEHAAAEWAV